MTPRGNAPKKRRVLVALDGSPAAATAVPIAARIAEQLAADVEALYVYSDGQSGEDLRARLQLPSDRANLVLRTLVGAPAEGIIRATADPAVALVVMTTRGRTISSEPRLGSVATGVIAAVTCPILLVNPSVAARISAGVTGLRRLLFPLDGTPTTAAALPPATRLASDLGASIDLLYVASHARPTQAERGSMGAPRYLDQPQHEWPVWEREIVDRLCTLCAACPPDVPVQAYLRVGDIGDEIVRFAIGHHDDAIILVRRSRFERGRAPVLRAALDHAPCPILLLGTSARE